MKMVFAMMLMTASVGFARTINIAIPDKVGTLKLTNPSSSAVIYNLACYDASGATVTNLNSQNLPAGGFVSHPVGSADLGTCAGGVAPTSSWNDANGKKVYRCATASVTYANAQNVCGSGQSFCYPKPTANDYSFCSLGQSWVKIESGVQYAPMCGSFSNITAGQAPYAPEFCSGGNLSDNGGTSRFYYVGLMADTSSLAGALCCENPVYAGVCKVTITSAAGALASPAFKGGAPF